MASIGRIAINGISNALESTQALANFQFDFSIVKVEPPREFHDLGSRLTPARRESAEDGKLHIVARRLGLMFESVLPQTPQLVKAYGSRASEIARESTQVSPDKLGIFARQAGIDGSSIWAGATSGSSAVQVHLLACLLARMWSSSEATSIWVELLRFRRTEIETKFDTTGSMDMKTLVAAKQQFDRSDLAEWDASARAWLRVADNCKTLQQKQLLLIIGNLSTNVNSRSGVYDSVFKVWTRGLETLEALLNGCPIMMLSSDIPLALSAWHIYPDLNVLDPVVKMVRQRDPLLPEAGILTIGLSRGEDEQDKGIRWSLPLAHLRFYGSPVIRTSTITPQGSRLSLEEFTVAVLGCVLGTWSIHEAAVGETVEWVAKLSRIVYDVYEKRGYPMKVSWLRTLGDAAELYMSSQGTQRQIFTQLLTLGRNHYQFVGSKSAPFFGLSEVTLAVSIAKTVEQKIRILRAHALSEK